MRFPRHLERQYAARLVRRLRVGAALLREQIEARTDGQREDVDDLGAWFAAQISAVRRTFEVVMPVRPESFTATATATDAWATNAVVRAVDRVVSIDIHRDPRVSPSALRDLHAGWIRTNVELIKTMDRETFDDLGKEVLRAVAEGRTDLAKTIQQRWGVAENRARLIARDQIAKLNGQITQRRQTALGVTQYEWSTSGDQRVRAEHRALDGKVFAWASPPAEGHPGQPIACRCVALPVLDEL